MKAFFKGKTAFITGASTGIGRATAIAFAQRGAQVAIVDRNIVEGQETLRLLEKMEVKAIFVKCDTSKEDEIKNAVDETIKKFKSLDFAFNNAGIEGTQGSTIDCTTENWDKVININLKGVWLCMKYQIPQMLKQTGGGAIVNCSSIAGVIGFPGIPAYVASKHGVIGLTKTAALEFAKQKIRVNAVCPGVIKTPMIDRFTHGEAQALKALSDGEPIGRVGQPEEIANAVLWLCSDEASFVTGHPMVVDGGWVAQ
ncbi:MAG: SDR family oxidoreductase [Oligoflexia bacterium]|nr:SDR family oxidoreductase [Oligoflexia bacterium]